MLREQALQPIEMMRQMDGRRQLVLACHEQRWRDRVQRQQLANRITLRDGVVRDGWRDRCVPRVRPGLDDSAPCNARQGIRAVCASLQQWRLLMLLFNRNCRLKKAVVCRTSHYIPDYLPDPRKWLEVRLTFGRRGYPEKNKEAFPINLLDSESGKAGG